MKYYTVLLFDSEEECFGVHEISSEFDDITYDELDKFIEESFIFHDYATFDCSFDEFEMLMEKGKELPYVDN